MNNNIENTTSNPANPNYQNFSVLNMYAEELTAKSYITNPAIERDEEIKRLIMVLLTPEKSGLLVGKAGTGKTAIVEGLAYRILNKDVPNALLDYKVYKINSASLKGVITINGREEMVISLILEELKRMSKVILFIDEIHTLIGGNAEGPMDLANILKPAIDRGEVKVIGATTDIEYNTYVVRDRAFLRRFDRIDVSEVSEAGCVKILMGTLPKIERQTGIKFKYNEYVTQMLIESIVSATSEYKRVYGLGAMYPDISLSVLTSAFSQALFQNHQVVDVADVYNAIKTSKRIYPDTIVKELAIFKEKFKDLCASENIVLPNVTYEEIKGPDDI
jgi:ATP-dependent Clp protease ATP-binding subunit ClpA